MTIERWHQIEGLFHAARKETAEQRERFLDEACRTDPELRQEVESLLENEELAAGFLESQVLPSPAQHVMSCGDPACGRNLGSSTHRGLAGTKGKGTPEAGLDLVGFQDNLYAIRISIFPLVEKMCDPPLLLALLCAAAGTEPYKPARHQALQSERGVHHE